MRKSDIRRAYVRMREADHTIPDEVLDFMRDAAIEKIERDKLEPTKDEYEGMPQTMSSIACEIIEDINAAIKKFGLFNYTDKGPDEVMDMRKWDKYFSEGDMPPADIAEVLLEVYGQPNGRRFVESLVAGLDHWPDEAFDELLNYDERLANFY